LRDKPYRVDPSFRGRDVTWRNMRAHYTARERDLMRSLPESERAFVHEAMARFKGRLS